MNYFQNRNVIGIIVLVPLDLYFRNKFKSLYKTVRLPLAPHPSLVIRKARNTFIRLLSHSSWEYSLHIWQTSSCKVNSLVFGKEWIEMDENIWPTSLILQEL